MLSRGENRSKESNVKRRFRQAGDDATPEHRKLLVKWSLSHPVAKFKGKRALAVLLLSAGAFLIPTPAGIVEGMYSTRLYPIVQQIATRVSNLAPFALLDVLILVVACWWTLALVGDLRRGRGTWMRAAAAILVRTIEVAGVLYLVFLVTWGLNYRRVPLADKLQFRADAVSQDAAAALAATAVERANALYDRAHAAGDGTALTDAFARSERDLGAARLAVPGRPKSTILDLYFRRAGVDGMTDPYFLETLIARDLLPFERPFVVAHEWSHLAGYADEGEANFVGWLTCLRGSDSDQYSGWLFLYGETMASVRPDVRPAIAARLAPGPRSDRRAIAERVRRQLNPRVSAVGWSVYDRYLKANRVEAGTASYAEVVRLALGVRFGPDWTPLRR